MQENPFRPAFGVAPPEIIGRENQIAGFVDALERGVGHPRRSTIFVGARGMGKTVVLNELAKKAMMSGWISVRVTVNPAMLDDALDQINSNAAHLVEIGRINLTGVTAAGFGLQFSAIDQQPLGWRQKITNKIIELEKYETGLLFLVDEVHASEPNLKIFLTAYQHLLMEERKVAIALAGLPSAVSDLLSVDVLTFLRRAYRERLGLIDVEAVSKGLGGTFSEYGLAISVEALAAAAEATGGYPYLIQMVGFQIWEQAREAMGAVGASEAERGIKAAKAALVSAVHETALSDLSGMDKEFLAAMSVDDGPSKMSDVAARMGRDAGYAGQYRIRLMEAGIIADVSYGHVDFTIPYMREFVRSGRETER